MTWESDTFAYAEGFDQGRYLGLRAGEQVAAVVDAASVVVKPEMARAQLDVEMPKPDDAVVKAPPAVAGAGAPAPTLVVDSKPRRFYGVVVVDPVRMSRDAGQVADEVVKHLAGLVDTNVEVRIEITASSEEGFADDVVRTVTENAKTLKFDQHGFEEQ
jgi:hypothetical protein